MHSRSPFLFTHTLTSRFFAASCALVAALFSFAVLMPADAQVAPQTIFFDVPSNIAASPNHTPTAQLTSVAGYPADTNRETLISLIWVPDAGVHGPGPYPTVIVLHGSGGMWDGDSIASGPKTPLERWGERLSDRGFICLMPDGFNPRGIPGNFGGRRPHFDSAIDDSACSPNYERPKDVVAALTYLTTRTDVDFERIGLLGFSHGSQTGLNAILDSSVDLGAYTEDYVNAQGNTVKHNVPAPVRVPASLPFPCVGIFYYPGCGHFSYHGSPSSTAAGRYMPDRRMSVVMHHGTSDSLLGVTDANASPMIGNLYPIKFTLASGAQAAAQGISNPFVAHHIFDHVAHSFDETTIETPGNWNTGAESTDEKANRLARDETLKWLEFRLRRHAVNPATDPVTHALSVNWTARDQLRYKHMTSTDLVQWTQQGGDITGNGGNVSVPVTLPVEQRLFHRLIIDPVPAPTTDPLYVNFFREYADFSY